MYFNVISFLQRFYLNGHFTSSSNNNVYMHISFTSYGLRSSHNVLIFIGKSEKYC